MPNVKKNAALVQDTNPATLSHETANQLKQIYKEFIDLDGLGWFAEDINEDLLEMLMYAMGSSHFEHALGRHNVIFSLRKVMKFITQMDSLRDELLA